MIWTLFLLFVAFVGIYVNVWFLLMILGNKSEIKSTKKVKGKVFPRISILIPTHNEAKHIGRTLRAILNLDYPKSKLETIVIDNGSTDDTVKVVKNMKAKHRGIRLLTIPRSGKVEALRLGLSKARHGVIGILDGDTFVTKDCLKNMVGYFDDDSIGAVTNNAQVTGENKFLVWLQNIEYIFSGLSKKLISLLDALYVVPGTLSLVKRELITEIGFSDDTLTEDMDMALCMIKKDYRIVNSMNAITYTIVPHSLKGLFKQRIRWYRGFIQNVTKHSDMLFNKRFSHLGYFVLPISSLLAIAIGVTMFIIFTYGMVTDGVMFIRRFLYIPFLDNLAAYVEIPNIITVAYAPYLLISYIIIIVSSFISMVVTFRVMEVKYVKKMLLLPVYFFVYYTLVMFFWLVSFVMEMVSWRREW